MNTLTVPLGNTESELDTDIHLFNQFTFNNSS